MEGDNEKLSEGVVMIVAGLVFRSRQQLSDCGAQRKRRGEMSSDLDW